MSKDFTSFRNFMIYLSLFLCKVLSYDYVLTTRFYKDILGAKLIVNEVELTIDRETIEFTTNYQVQSTFVKFIYNTCGEENKFTISANNKEIVLNARKSPYILRCIRDEGDYKATVKNSFSDEDLNAQLFIGSVELPKGQSKELEETSSYGIYQDLYIQTSNCRQKVLFDTVIGKIGGEVIEINDDIFRQTTDSNIKFCGFYYINLKGNAPEQTTIKYVIDGRGITSNKAIWPSDGNLKIEKGYNFNVYFYYSNEVCQDDVSALQTFSASQKNVVQNIDFNEFFPLNCKYYELTIDVKVSDEAYEFGYTFLHEEPRVYKELTTNPTALSFSTRKYISVVLLKSPAQFSCSKELVGNSGQTDQVRPPTITIKDSDIPDKCKTEEVKRIKFLNSLSNQKYSLFCIINEQAYEISKDVGYQHEFKDVTTVKFQVKYQENSCDLTKTLSVSLDSSYEFKITDDDVPKNCFPDMPDDTDSSNAPSSDCEEIPENEAKETECLTCNDGKTLCIECFDPDHYIPDDKGSCVLKCVEGENHCQKCNEEKTKCLECEEGFELVNDVCVATGTGKEEKKKGLSGGAIAGIVIGCVAAVGIAGVLVWYFVFYRKSKVACSEDVEP
ncbi:hypothetical protein M9Y10_006324 [Tritrichomonas musculus]|uniref:Uncharacterized protein n=1 Tax=Tritrichomonas musculus TaxID=1915356 RepID=A0ABR2JDV1_9EUKA